MQRVKELDSIRGLASLAIVVYHLWLTGIGLLGAAVDLFFVLSGFLITSILLAHQLNRHFLISFYARRALRIWPIYYLSLIILVLINPLTAAPGSLTGLPYYLSFTQNVSYHWSASTPPFIPAFRHTWSLAIEEQFYLLWPALIWVMGHRRLGLMALGLVSLAVTARAFHFNSWMLATHCDGLALGAVLASLRVPSPDARYHPEPRFLTFGGAACAFWLGGAVFLRLTPPAWQPSLLALVQSFRFLAVNVVFFSLVGLVTRCSGSRWLGFLRHRWLVYLGQISYGLYLYHHIVFMLWDDFAARAGIVNHLGFDLAKAGVSVLIAVLSWEFVERPLLSLKNLFAYQQAANPYGLKTSHAPVPHGGLPVPVNGALYVAPSLAGAEVSGAGAR
jgi:peptidoglycan/LPS O-acetylase OafA/YrhL